MILNATLAKTVLLRCIWLMIPMKGLTVTVAEVL